MIFDYKSDPKLLDALKAGAQRSKSGEEKFQQKVSFIFAGLSPGNTLSKADIAYMLKSERRTLPITSGPAPLDTKIG